jgi:CheY-like chemotaxis protein
MLDATGSVDLPRHNMPMRPLEELAVAARRILIVEDEMMIAMMVEDFLSDLGWHALGVACTLEKALEMARNADFEAALLDVNLNGRDTFDVADILIERNIPFVFATGYGAQGIAQRFRAVPTLAKPYQLDDLDGALQQAMAGAEGQHADPETEDSSRGTSGTAQ